MAHIKRLLDAGLPGEQIGVITPYNGQVAALRELRGDRETAVEISSVDGFQGRRLKLQMAQCRVTTTFHNGDPSEPKHCSSMTNSMKQFADAIFFMHALFSGFIVKIGCSACRAMLMSSAA